MNPSAAALTDFATRAFLACGLDRDKAQTTAQVLVEGDLLGHSTHGLALLPGYLDALKNGSMSTQSAPQVLQSRAATALWDGQRLPGPWLVTRAISAAKEMARTCGAGTIVIRNSHHIACLAAYLEAPAREGFVTQILSSDPAVKAVAPHGGRVPVMTPNPLAISWPTKADPVIVDVSMSVTAMGMTRRLFDAGESMPIGWATDAEGNATTDPGAIWNEPKGALMPLGSDLAGHKGYGLGLMIEALTGGLAGYGRADGVSGWGATVQIQIYDPEAFGGMQALTKQTDAMRESCQKNPPRPGFERVLMPGERGLARKRAQLEGGLVLHESIIPKLRAIDKAFSLALF